MGLFLTNTKGGRIAIKELGFCSDALADISSDSGDLLRAFHGPKFSSVPISPSICLPLVWPP
jgi:hypothetical protein